MAERFGQDLLLLERLAAGGMAEVYRAKQIGYGGFEKTVAVKRILPNFASDEEFKGMFRQEANLSACLQHQGIVQVFGNGEHDGYLYLVMEFVDGKNVRQILSRCERKKKRIPIELSLFIVAETAKGLNYAHNYCDEKSGQPLSIVHRDMSPQNIMVGYDSSVKIVDFGIAKAASWADNTRAGVLKGKFGYMSPEQARGDKLDNRTDIFALGIILFEILTQRRLFTSEDDLRTIKMVKECNVPRPSKYNPAITSQLDRIVLKTLEKNKADRYQQAQELFEDLTLYLSQKYPKFVSTELSRFTREIFKEDIEEDRKKREKQAAEAPALVGSAEKRDARPKGAAKVLDDRDRTDSGPDNDNEKTQLSNSTNKAPYKNEEALETPPDLDIPEIEDENLSPPPMSAVELSRQSQVQASLAMAEKSVTSSSVKPLITAAAAGPMGGTNSLYSLPVENIPLKPMPTHYNPRPFAKAAKSRNPRLFLLAALVLIIAAIVARDENAALAPSTPVAEGKSEVVDPALVTKGLPPNPEPAVEAPIDRPIASVRKITLRELQGSKGPFGRVRFNTIPRVDEFYVNGKLVVDESGEALNIDGQDFLMPPGEFQVQLRNTGFDKEWSGTLTVHPDQRHDRDIVFQ